MQMVEHVMLVIGITLHELLLSRCNPLQRFVLVENPAAPDREPLLYRLARKMDLHHVVRGGADLMTPVDARMQRRPKHLPPQYAALARHTIRPMQEPHG